MAFEVESFRKELRQFRETRNADEFLIKSPEWQAVTDRFAKKLGIDSPRVIRVPTRFINAFASVDGEIFVSDGMMKMLECDHLGAPSRPMQAAIAHEMGHLKFDMKHLRDMRRLPETLLKHTLWLTLPVATVLAYRLYENAVNAIPTQQSLDDREEKKKILEHVDRAVETTLEAERSEIKNGNGNPDYLTWITQNLYNARYWVAGALGLGVGIAAHKYTGRMAEFRADRVAVELMGEVESFNILKDRFPREASKVWMEMNTKPIAATFGERLERFVKTEGYFLKNKILGVHPSWRERAEKAGAHLARLKETGRPIDVRPF